MSPSATDPTVPTLTTELMLLRWAESSNGGASITFLLSDAAELAPFKAMTVAKGGKAGQRFMAALALLGDDEQPVPVPGLAAVRGQQGPGADPHQARRPLGGPLARLAGQWCADAAFQRWIRQTHGQAMAAAWGETEAADMAPAEFARQAILLLCGIDSRAELDHDEAAEDEFHTHVRLPYADHLERLRR